MYPAKAKIVMVLALFGPPPRCCWMAPFCMNSFKDARHECPNCGYTVGMYRLGLSE